MTHHERLEAKLEPFVEQLPKGVLVLVGKYAYLRQIDAYHALIETSLELEIAVFVLPRRKKASAPHAGKHVALIGGAHLLCRNVVGIKSLGGALDRKLCDVVVFAAFETVVFVKHVDELGESRRDVNTLSFLCLRDADGEFPPLSWRSLPDTRRPCRGSKQGDKGRLTVCGHQSVNLILYGLNAAFELFPQAGVDKFVHGLVVEMSAGYARNLTRYFSRLRLRYLPRCLTSTD